MKKKKQEWAKEEKDEVKEKRLGQENEVIEEVLDNLFSVPPA